MKKTKRKRRKVSERNLYKIFSFCDDSCESRIFHVIRSYKVITRLRMIHAWEISMRVIIPKKKYVSQKQSFFYFNSYLSVIVQTNFNLHRTSAM